MLIAFHFISFSGVRSHYIVPLVVSLIFLLVVGGCILKDILTVKKWVASKQNLNCHNLILAFLVIFCCLYSSLFTCNKNSEQLEQPLYIQKSFSASCLVWYHVTTRCHSFIPQQTGSWNSRKAKPRRTFFLWRHPLLCSHCLIQLVRRCHLSQILKKKNIPTWLLKQRMLQCGVKSCSYGVALAQEVELVVQGLAVRPTLSLCPWERHFTNIVHIVGISQCRCGSVVVLMTLRSEVLIQLIWIGALCDDESDDDNNDVDDDLFQLSTTAGKGYFWIEVEQSEMCSDKWISPWIWVFFISSSLAVYKNVPSVSQDFDLPQPQSS